MHLHELRVFNLNGIISRHRTTLLFIQSHMIRSMNTASNQNEPQDHGLIWSTHCYIIMVFCELLPLTVLHFGVYLRERLK